MFALLNILLILLLSGDAQPEARCEVPDDLPDMGEFVPDAGCLERDEEPLECPLGPGMIDRDLEWQVECFRET